MISKHKLDYATWRPSPNHGGIITPELVVIHYTGSNSLVGAMSWLCSPAARVSAHLVISKSGQVFQLVPFNVAAWHAGKSEYSGRSGVNQFSIGIEHVGLGDEWPEAQVDALVKALKEIVLAYDIEDFVGHEDVAVPAGRKADPGPNFPWDYVRGQFQDVVVA